MKARDIIGKRVARIEQQRFRTDFGTTEWCLDAIVFEDGSRLDFDVAPSFDSGDEPGGDGAPVVRATYQPT